MDRKEIIKAYSMQSLIIGYWLGPEPDYVEQICDEYDYIEDSVVWKHQSSALTALWPHRNSKTLTDHPALVWMEPLSAIRPCS